MEKEIFRFGVFRKNGISEKEFARVMRSQSAHERLGDKALLRGNFKKANYHQSVAFKQAHSCSILDLPLRKRVYDSANRYNFEPFDYN